MLIPKTLAILQYFRISEFFNIIKIMCTSQVISFSKKILRKLHTSKHVHFSGIFSKIIANKLPHYTNHAVKYLKVTINIHLVVAIAKDIMQNGCFKCKIIKKTVICFSLCCFCLDQLILFMLFLWRHKSSFILH